MPNDTSDPRFPPIPDSLYEVVDPPFLPSPGPRFNQDRGVHDPIYRITCAGIAGRFRSTMVPGSTMALEPVVRYVFDPGTERVFDQCPRCSPHQFEGVATRGDSGGGPILFYCPKCVTAITRDTMAIGMNEGRKLERVESDRRTKHKARGQAFLDYIAASFGTSSKEALDLATPEAIGKLLEDLEQVAKTEEEGED